MKRRTGAKRPSAFWLLVPLYACLFVLFMILIKRGQVQLLTPAGYIADIQSRLLTGALIFAAIVGSGIIITFFVIVTRYKEGASRKYEPGRRETKKLVTAAWGIPLAAILVISAVDWSTAHLVDPYRTISSKKAPVTIQVVALRWKWLFIYPNDHIATINTLEIPVGTPIALQLTADAPMNSFWIPRLSGQIYAMTGMVTQLHIEADQPGTYTGSPAEMSGDGFAGMYFAVKAVSSEQYAAWKASTKHSKQQLTYTAFTQLARPSSYVPPAAFAAPDPNLFQEIVMQFMSPGADPSTLQIRGETI